MELKKISQEELNEILEKHSKLLNEEEGGEIANLEYADLNGANLNGANLSSANLSSANLRGANLSGANLSDANLGFANLKGADFEGTELDYSCFPLWCGSLDVHIDDRLAYQLLYHLLRNVSYSKNISECLKQKLLTPELTELANKFHRTKECGEITAYKDLK